ncbi:hypothetical protein RAS1_23450 [Phycisphaerae bacterium RAS1]|nr:hypothetical protein RAS1_23450 [Phycisphaerae bacterium RAS1]
MPNYVRWRERGAAYFFTVVAAGRRPILTSDQSRRFLREAIDATRAKWPFDMPACVLLPDHLHCIWQLPTDDDDFPLRWRLIKSRFTTAFLSAGGIETGQTADHKRQRRRGVFQARYWEHRLRDEADYIMHRDYIHMNPVKHGYVRTPEEWPWSTVHEHLRRGELAPDWWTTVRIQLPEFE